MAYSDFSLRDLEKQFGIKNFRKELFQHTTSVLPSERLVFDIDEIKELQLRSEKSKSEWIVVPILRELRNRNEKFFTIYSGENLNANEAVGLKGECDFILAKDVGSYEMNLPIIQVVEAKKNDIDIGIPQCAAQLLGAKIFNESNGVKIDCIYGCVTTGDDWLFMKLENDLMIDTKKY